MVAFATHHRPDQSVRTRRSPSERVVGRLPARYVPAQATTYIATASKSNRPGNACWAAVSDVEANGAMPVPLHLRNAAHRGMRQHGIGVGYRYLPTDQDYEGTTRESARRKLAETERRDASDG